MATAKNNDSRIRRGLQRADLDRAKRQTNRLAYNLYLMSVEDETLPNWAVRVQRCSTYWRGFRCPDCGSLHHLMTYGCYHRLCPLCSVRRSRALAAQAVEVMEEIVARAPDAHLGLLTLTQKNVSGDALPGEMDRLIDAWSRLRFIRSIRRDLVGWARNIEVTIGEDGTYHPHVHVLILCRNPEMLEDAYWRTLWRRNLDLDYIPVCNAKPVSNYRAVFEISKYVSKVGAILDMKSDGHVYDAIRHLSKALAGRRLRSFGGLWAKVRRERAMVDVDSMDDGQLAATGGQLDATEVCCVSSLVPISLVWSGLEFKEVD